MAKTYEALLKQKNSVEQDISTAALSSTPALLTLQNKKQIADLEKKLLYYSKKNNYKVFNFAGCRKHEGVTSILTSLAHYFLRKKTEKKIVLIDADLHNSGLHKLFQIPVEPGLTDLLTNRCAISDALHQIENINLFVIPSGISSRKTIGDIPQDNMIELTEKIREQFDYILIDSPPLLEATDSLSVAIASDLTFLVLRANKVQREVAEKAKLLLQGNDCAIGGVIFNRALQVIPGWIYRLF